MRLMIFSKTSSPSTMFSSRRAFVVSFAVVTLFTFLTPLSLVSHMLSLFALVIYRLLFLFTPLAIVILCFPLHLPFVHFVLLLTRSTFPYPPCFLSLFQRPPTSPLLFPLLVLVVLFPPFHAVLDVRSIPERQVLFELVRGRRSYRRVFPATSTSDERLSLRVESLFVFSLSLFLLFGFLGMLLDVRRLVGRVPSVKRGVARSSCSAHHISRIFVIEVCYA
ncbi:unnamed protein product [Periconia digitata]|uniref:Transmembrane protein n=1 Tax=Periconia digitata TaxID=1303443 RepID=A0A9W4UN44_9PLEO|nr:unnamed protein product [Periconia digitata]